MEIKTFTDFEHHVMNQLTKTLEGLDNLLEAKLITFEEYALNVKKARLLFEGKLKNFKIDFNSKSKKQIQI